MYLFYHIQNKAHTYIPIIGCNLKSGICNNLQSKLRIFPSATTNTKVNLKELFEATIPVWYINNRGYGITGCGVFKGGIQN